MTTLLISSPSQDFCFFSLSHSSGKPEGATTIYIYIYIYIYFFLYIYTFIYIDFSEAGGSEIVSAEVFWIRGTHSRRPSLQANSVEEKCVFFSRIACVLLCSRGRQQLPCLHCSLLKQPSLCEKSCVIVESSPLSHALIDALSHWRLWLLEETSEDLRQKRTGQFERHQSTGEGAVI